MHPWARQLLGAAILHAKPVDARPLVLLQLEEIDAIPFKPREIGCAEGESLEQSNKQHPVTNAPHSNPLRLWRLVLLLNFHLQPVHLQPATAILQQLSTLIVGEVPDHAQQLMPRWHEGRALEVEGIPARRCRRCRRRWHGADHGQRGCVEDRDLPAVVAYEQLPVMVHVLGDKVRHRHLRPAIPIHRLRCGFTPSHEIEVEKELPGVVQHHRRRGVVIGGRGDEVALDDGVGGGER